MHCIKYILLIGLALILSYGASCPPQEKLVQRPSPEKNLLVMRDALDQGDYSTAYYCLSKNTRQRYSFNEFKLMLQYTIFGILVRSILVNWDVTDVKYFAERSAQEIKTAPKDSGKETTTATDQNEKPKLMEKARVTFQHWKYPEYQKEFIFIYEDNGWRIDFTMASIVGVPQEDEDRLLPDNQPKEKRGR